MHGEGMTQVVNPGLLPSVSVTPDPGQDADRPEVLLNATTIQPLPPAGDEERRCFPVRTGQGQAPSQIRLKFLSQAVSDRDEAGFEELRVPDG